MHAPPQLSPERLARVVKHVELHFQTIENVRELADVAALSTFHFCRLFRDTMGMTPMRYVWEHRVQRAQCMLRNSTASLAHIAADCGFRSQSHFTTRFKLITGVTPAVFRSVGH